MRSDREGGGQRHRTTSPHARPGMPVRHPTCRNGHEIARAALLAELREAQRIPFVLISAPAGYGKSTLLSQWRASQRQPGRRHPGAARPRPFAVATLDNADNDPHSFWRTIVGAVEQACPAVAGTRLRAAIEQRAPDMDAADIDTVLPRLLDEIATHCPHLILALDDYQTITTPECHEQVDYLLHHLPAPGCLVLVTRTEPPLPLARMRTRGEIVELRAADLRFTRHEVAEVVRAVGEHDLDDADLDELADRTEGWPAMVRVAARQLGAAGDAAAALRTFGGTHREVADYLDEEILRHLPGDVQRFLVRTSVLHRFTAELCDTVAETASSADLLDGLERSNLLLVPLDGVRRWYRYHRLFAEALRDQLARTEPDTVAALHQKAAAWHESEGPVGDAITHLLGAGNPRRAVDLVARHWARRVLRGELAEVHGWLEELGAERAAQSPLAAACAAWVASLSGERTEGQRWLKTVERLGGPSAMPDGMRAAEGAVALYRACFGFGGIGEMLAAARTATDLHADPASPWYAQARLALGYSRYLAGELSEAIVPLERAADASTGLPVVRIQALAVLSLVTGELGRPAQSADLARAADEHARRWRLAGSTQVSLADVARAAVLVRQGRPLRARQILEGTLRSRRAALGLPPWPTLNALLLHATVVLALGDRAEARALLDEAADIAVLLPDGSDRVTAGLAELERRLAGGEAQEGGAPAPLTDREEAVLRLLQSSLPLREIAAQLFVTVNTVKSHTRLVYRKLGVSSRTEAVRRARERGLL